MILSFRICALRHGRRQFLWSGNGLELRSEARVVNRGPIVD